MRGTHPRVLAGHMTQFVTAVAILRTILRLPILGVKLKPTHGTTSAVYPLEGLFGLWRLISRHVSRESRGRGSDPQAVMRGLHVCRAVSWMRKAVARLGIWPLLFVKLFPLFLGLIREGTGTDLRSR